MPPQWALLLKSSNIPSAEQAKHPDLMLDVLQCYDESNKPKDKYMTNISGVTSESSFSLFSFPILCQSRQLKRESFLSSQNLRVPCGRHSVAWFVDY